MKKTLLVLFALMAMAMSACEHRLSGAQRSKVTTQAVQTPYFENIEIAGSYDVHFTQGDKISVSVRGTAKSRERLSVQVVGKTLYVKAKSKGYGNFWSDSDDVDIYVTAPNLLAVSIIGSGEFECEKKIDTSSIKLLITGSGNIDINNLICNNITAKIAGSGDIDLKKLVTDTSFFSISGSGDIEVENAKINKATNKIAGSGDISITGIVNHHDDNVAGSGDIVIN